MLHMIRRFRCLIGFNQRYTSSPSKRLLNAKPTRVKPAMLETIQEVAIYIHRFHNLDLFQQGWYQIRITMRWEDSDYTTPGFPARVAQYEAPDLGPDDVVGVWRIDDTDNGFYTQPFRIKYARQDVLLSAMVAFNLSLGKYEGPATSAVIVKFELLYAPILDNGSELPASLDTLPAAIHEFRIPPKALLGLHSYCPVHFDSFHAVLIDLSMHIILLKAGSFTSPAKVPSYAPTMKNVAVGSLAENGQLANQGVCIDKKKVATVKALLTARDFLLDELLKLSNAIDQKIDLTELTSELKQSRFSSVLQSYLGITEDILEKPSGISDFETEEFLQALSNEDVINAFHLLGHQLSVLWNIYLKFHRANRTKILDFLREAWANDRRAEWSIWMVYSKVAMPHHCLRSDESFHRSIRGKGSLAQKLNEDPIQAAVTRADLHRRSIAQMRINNRSIQDMYIFGDPLRNPVILVERVMNAQFRTRSGNSFFSPLDHSANILMGTRLNAGNKLSGTGTPRSSRILRIIVFVHGFQGHHLDLRLVRNQWLLIDPGAECLMSEVNEDRTSGDLTDMGSRLAEEVTAFVKKKMDRAARSGGYKNIKLSFVGHSIGNVILRAALMEKKMEPFLKYLYTYVSVSGPHLGYLYSSNSLFNYGLWLLKKLKGAQCIHQLTFTDDPDLEKTFFYKLCKAKTLEHFKNIILLSSPQDGYVPYHSARIEVCPASLWDYSKKGKIFMDMLNNCLDQIRAPSSEQRMFMRCDVNYDTSGQTRNLNTMIGRAAHIEFLETDIFARFIMMSFSELFR
ncbi:hypothetical protein MKX01_029653 [Papaver californicum]|nr:hypothetical protein MKX01_029653 [Papaver californicum]